MAALAPWRMTLAFFIGGVATRCMSQSYELGAFVLDCVVPRGVPFVVAVVVLAPVLWWVTGPDSHAYGYLRYLPVWAEFPALLGATTLIPLAICHVAIPGLTRCGSRSG